MQICPRFCLLSFFALFLASCGNSGTTTPPPPLSDKFADIQTQTLNGSCAISGCHVGSSPKALLNLQTGKAYSQLMNNPIQNDAALKRYSRLVVPGKPDSSFLYIKLTNPKTDEGELMPQRTGTLSKEELDAIRSWITRGAPND